MKNFSKKLSVAALIASCVLGLAAPMTSFAVSPATVDLGTAANFTILSKAAITDIPTSIITGNVGASPISGSSIGVPCGEVTGIIYDTDAGYSGGGGGSTLCRVTNAPLLGTAVSAMEAAYTDASTRTPTTDTEINAGLLGAITPTFAAGIYKWSTDVTISQDITLSGSATDVWIFQIAGDLTTASAGSLATGVHINLIGGAKASNVFWAVAGPVNGVTLGTNTTFNGNILSLTQIAMQTGAVLAGRALAQTQITLHANTVALATATLHVVKLVVNTVRSSVASDFTVHVKSGGVDIAGSPAPGVGGLGTTYAVSDGTYTVSENQNDSYVQTFSVGDCDSGGNVTISGLVNLTCTIINTDIPPSAGGGFVTRIVPLIGILKVPAPLALPGGPGPVAYGYTVWNVGGQQALTDVTVTDDMCGSPVLLSGDLNNNSKLDPIESWKYSCTTTLGATTTNTAVATGYSDDPYHEAAIATAVATVVVGAPVPPPLINIVKVPSRLTPLPFGGGDVTYTYTVTNPGVVAMHDVVVTDDKCDQVSRVYGDTNGDNLLDPGEAWTYSCQEHISFSTRNVAMAQGSANGFTTLGYAFAEVFVSAPVPTLPNTGSSPEGTAARDIAGLAAILLVVSTSLIIRLRKSAL